MKDTTTRKKSNAALTNPKQLQVKKTTGEFDLPCILLSPFELGAGWDPGTAKQSTEPVDESPVKEDPGQEEECQPEKEKHPAEEKTTEGKTTEEKTTEEKTALLQTAEENTLPIPMTIAQSSSDSLETMIDRLLNEMNSIGREEARYSSTPRDTFYPNQLSPVKERKSEESVSRPVNEQHSFLAFRPSISTPLHSARAHRVRNNRHPIQMETKKTPPTSSSSSSSNSGFGKLNLFGLRKGQKEMKSEKILIEQVSSRKQMPLLRTESYPTDIFQKLSCNAIEEVIHEETHRTNSKKGNKAISGSSYNKPISRNGDKHATKSNDRNANGNNDRNANGNNDRNANGNNDRNANGNNDRNANGNINGNTIKNSIKNNIKSNTRPIPSEQGDEAIMPPLKGINQRSQDC
ncbi:hypothetical protein BDF14DRAFT_1089126 [Spinellus fusiger]|nr:hypothetical protein BDF14DRAFT_1089126 [Spinellus fusiger]